MPSSSNYSSFDAAAVSAFLRDFTSRHRAPFERLGNRQSQVLEVAAAAASAQHYVAHGYALETLNPRGRVTFCIKRSTRGHPADYSRFLLTRGPEAVELHLNCSVRGGRDAGIYCVDVGVVPQGIVPLKRRRSEKWISAPNEALITFVESKRLLVYPMLIAQFIGEVHEILPRFIRWKHDESFSARRHFPPTMISLGSYSGNSREIVASFKRRRLNIRILENFDFRVTQLRTGESLWL